MRSTTQRAVRGAFAYGGRQLAVTCFNIVTGLLLTRILKPEDFGYASVVAVVTGFAAVVSDGGLGVYLVQRRKEITNEDVSAITATQLRMWAGLFLILSVLIGVIWTCGGQISVWIMTWVAAWSVPFGVMRSASVNFLDRDLRFDKIAVIESGEQLIFTVSVLGLAIMEAGVWSIVAAGLIRAFFGWQIASRYANACLKVFATHRPIGDFKDAIKFGALFQLPSILETVRASINPLLIGSLLGMASAGYVDRAVMVAGMPNGFLASIWRRVLFPYVARIQEDVVLGRKVFEQAIYIHSVLDKCIYIPLLAFGPDLIQAVLGTQWLPIVPVVYILSIGNVVFAAYSTSAIAFLYGHGKPQIMARWSVYQLVAAWLLAVIFVRQLGYVGYGYVSIVLWTGVFYMHYHVRNIIGKTRVFRAIMPPILAMGASVMFARVAGIVYFVHPLSIKTIIALSAIAIIVYIGILWVIDGHHMRETIAQVRENMRGKQKLSV